MAQIIEFVGPSGVGKSTTYAALNKLWRPGDKWTPFHKCDFGIERTVKESVEVGVRYITGKIVPNVNERIINAAKSAFIDQHPAIVDQYWKCISNRPLEANGKDLRLNVLNFIMHLSATCQLVDNYKKARYCILEEGLIQNLGFLISSGEESELKAQVNHFIKMLPFNLIVFHFQIDIDNLIGRALSREKRTFLDKGLTPSQVKERLQKSLAKQNSVIEILESKNIRVINVDATKSPTQNAVNLQSILNQLP